MHLNYFKPTTLLDKFYEIGLFFKGFDGVLETIGGVLLLVLSPHTINAVVRTLTQHELSEDPRDLVATHITQYGHALASGHTLFASLFLLTHGLVKIGLVVCLLLNRLWAYPAALVVLGVFLIYQLYVLMVRPSFGMVFLSVLDAVIIWLVWREWQQVKQKPTTVTTGS